MQFLEGKSQAGKALIGSGLILIVAAIGLLILNFGPLLDVEVSYIAYQNSQDQFATDNSVVEEFHTLLGLSDDSQTDNFMIFIPQINARSRVIENVDPFDSAAYFKALESGVAHAKGTPLPGSIGNTFLFAHSGRNFYEGTHQNVQFYLLDRLNVGDFVYLRYYSNIYKYEITAAKKVWPSEVEYLTNQYYDYNKLTLMSCWPAGINYQRQIVEARLIAVFNQ